MAPLPLQLQFGLTHGGGEYCAASGAASLDEVGRVFSVRCGEYGRLGAREPSLQGRQLPQRDVDMSLLQKYLTAADRSINSRTGRSATTRFRRASENPFQTLTQASVVAENSTS